MLATTPYTTEDLIQHVQLREQQVADELCEAQDNMNGSLQLKLAEELKQLTLLREQLEATLNKE